MSHACHRFWHCYETLMFYSLLARRRIPRACHAKPHLKIEKWSEHVVFFNMLTSKCASCHNSVRFFNISTSKSGPELECFVKNFDLEMCFAPLRCTLFGHLNFQKCPNMVCFAHLDFQMCFPPQRRAIFISHLATWLRTCRFSEPSFRPSGATNHWENRVFRDFATVSRACIFLFLTLSFI